MAYTYTSSSTTVATVDANGVVRGVAPGIATITVNAAGTGTGFSAATLTGAATVTVSALPAGLTALTVSPTSVTLSTGGTATVVPSVTQPSGATAATYTYGTTAPAVATVSSTGVITAVGSGDAVITVTATSAANSNFAASTLSATVAVTVRQAPQIAIAYINTTAGAAVNVNSVNGQIQVGTNLVTNGQNVSGVQVFACPISQAACPTAGQTPVAQQTFGAGGASSGTVEFSINTAAFSVASDWSSSTVNFVNGQTRLVATVTVAGSSATSATGSSTILNMNNDDGWAARHVAPVRSASIASNAWYGGPGDDGRGRITIVPVTYTAGRTVVSARVGLASTATCGAAVSLASGTARPWTITYGYTTAAGTVANAANNIICTGTSAAADHNIGAIDNAVDNNNIAYPGAAAAANLLTTTAVTPAVSAPAAIRVDYAAPAAGAGYVPQGTYAADRWINGAYSFGTTAAQANFIDASGSTVTAAYQYTTLPLATTPVWTTVTSGADIPESTTDLSNGAYRLRYTLTDVLGNVTTASSVGATDFGVDKTAPVIRITASTDTNSTIYATAPLTAVADTAYSAEALDERSGFSATAASYAVAKTARATNTGRCWTGAAFAATATTAGAVVGASPVTAPTCTPTTTGATLDAALADGYRPINMPFRTVNGGQLAADGYYYIAATITDRAGNSASAPARVILSNMSASTATSDPLLTTVISSIFPTPFTGTATDAVEVAGSGLRVSYGADVFGYPATATSAVSFDNIVAAGAAVTGAVTISNATPFSSGVRVYTNVEKTNGSDGIDGAAVNNLAGFGFYAFNFGGNGGASTFSAPASVTGDLVAWGTKVPALLTAGTTFMVVDSTAAFNSPAGGLKVRVAGSTLTASPFTRVDYYMVRGGVNEYLGSVDASAAPCTSASSTCNVYVADNGGGKVFTYVLRTAGNPSTSFTNMRWCGTSGIAAAPNGSAACRAAGAFPIVAVGTTGTSGRALMTRAVTLP